ncbi:YhcN/YlaJ family sporulation lipoprotein [Oceanobacillus senegalensis]|uniref:YhcN/YlaJ family sporulation lipoprotein n=1 Tax=Oceanobacillus senegalensis TaxID=1936063 RepID=UPI000A312136|nr:YhcN/YlaJ family sporulation lipoprotein [Oceanobacillus senegalensis]
MLKKKTIFIIGFVLTVAVGCTNQDENAQTNTDTLDTQPIHYDSKKEHESRNVSPNNPTAEQGRYPKGKQDMMDIGNVDYQDPFVNEETQRITKELTKNRDIIQAQVASIDDRIIVAVMLRKHFNHDASNDSEAIKKEVEKMVPDKQIIVYTDDIQWDRMKNFNARYNAGKNGENIEEFFDNLINQTD